MKIIVREESRTIPARGEEINFSIMYREDDSPETEVEIIENKILVDNLELMSSGYPYYPIQEFRAQNALKVFDEFYRKNFLK